MKPFEEWSYDDLISNSAWEVMRGITRGQKLESSISAIHRTHVVWHEMIVARNEADQKKRKGANK